MGLYCGIDLHSNNHVLAVIDEADRRSSELRQRALYSKPLSRRGPGSRRALPLEVASMKVRVIGGASVVTDLQDFRFHSLAHASRAISLSKVFNPLHQTCCFARIVVRELPQKSHRPREPVKRSPTIPPATPDGTRAVRRVCAAPARR
jgi:hypothetical protein